MIRTRSVRSDPVRRSDGLRILVTRLRGRGITKDRCDVWMPSLAPSGRLIKTAGAGKLTWAQFERAYARELLNSPGFDRANRHVKNHGQKFTLRLIKALGKRGTVTLLCHCPDGQRQCHMQVLKKLIQSKRV